MLTDPSEIEPDLSVDEKLEALEEAGGNRLGEDEVEGPNSI